MGERSGTPVPKEVGQPMGDVVRTRQARDEPARHEPARHGPARDEPARWRPRFGSARAIRATLAAFVGVAAVGLVSSMLRAERDVWAMPTLSHLSADPGAGSIFRSTMAVVGLIGLALAAQVVPLLRRLRARGLLGRRWAALFTVAFWVMPLGFLGVAAFPLGVAPLIELAHGTAAYAIPIAVIVLMLTARLAIPSLGHGFGRASLLVIAAALLLYLAALGGLMSYALMEAIAFGIGAAWFVAFVERLVRLDEGAKS
jgi:hypothetical protein